MSRRRTSILLYIGFALIVAALVIAANIMRGNSTLKATATTIADPSADTLLLPSDIDTLLLTQMPQLPSLCIKDINLHAIRSAVQSNPYVASCKASISAGRTLRLNITQRQPVMQLLLPDKHTLLYDITATPMPPHPLHTPQVPLVIASSTDSLHIAQSCCLASFLARNTQYRRLAPIIHLQPDGSLLTSPPGVPYTILIGNADSLHSKFTLLSTLLRTLPPSRLNTYKTINLQYHNQIVCQY